LLGLRAFSADGTTVARATNHSGDRVELGRLGRREFRSLQFASAAASSRGSILSLSADGTKLARAVSDPNGDHLSVYDAATGGQLSQVTLAHVPDETMGITRTLLSFSADGRRLGYARSDVAVVWDWSAPDGLAPPLEHGGPLVALAVGRNSFVGIDAKAR
jgi:hypothetical protein